MRKSLFSSANSLAAIIWTVPLFTTYGQPPAHPVTDRTTLSSRTVTVNPGWLSRLTNSGNKIYSLDASHGTVATNAFDPRASRQSLNLSKNQIHLIPSAQPGSTNASKLTKGKIYLPSKVCVARETGSNDVTLIGGDLFLEASPIPLHWDSQKKAFATTLDIGVDFPSNSGVTALPGGGLTFALLTENASVDRRSVTITHANPPYESVVLVCPNPRAEATITAHNPNIPDKPLKVHCTLDLGGLKVEHTGAGRIFGYGLGTAKVIITRLATDQSPFADSQEIAVTLSTLLGKFPSGGLAIIQTNQSHVEVELRSMNVGLETITATFGSIVSNPDKLQFVFPTAFIIAALIGGCLGGCGQIFRKRPRTAASRIKYVLEGCLVGVIVVAAAAAGIVIFTLPTAVLGTELGAFVLASFAGYVGTPVLDKLVTKNTEGSTETKPEKRKR